MNSPKRKAPEILAPVGSPDCLAAAVAGGANAVYLGLRHFNARGRAENFRKADLARDVAYLHHHSVKCYLVMNTLIHDDEYPKALDLAGCAQDAGIDAVIIQDLGLWRSLAREFPKLERHASTQMTVHHPSQVAALAALGAKRVILARELTLDEVAACTVEAHRLGIETEHFVHGALCYAYSGQCLMSNFAGCRSANRGTCAQNCRFDYSGDAVAAQPGAKGEAVDTVLSMKDLALIGHVGRLADIGVASLKIEGRLKGPDYVYTTSRIYRAAAEAWERNEAFDVARAQEMLRGVFARIHTDAPLTGDRSARSRLHRYTPDRDRPADALLVSLDRRGGRIEFKSEVEPRAGQGFAYAHGMYTGGFLVIAVDPAGPGQWRCKVRMSEHGPPLPPGLPLFLNSDHERKREAAQAMAAVALERFPDATVGVRIAVSGKLDAPMQLRAIAADGRVAETQSAVPLGTAKNAPLDSALVTEKIGALGGTPFHLAGLDLALPEGLFLPAAELKRLRRALVDALSAQPAPEAAAEGDAEPTPRWSPPEPGVPRRRHAELWVAVGSVAAARAALAAGASAAWLEDASLDLWAAQPPAIDRAGIAAGALWLRHPATARPSPHLAALGLPIVAGHLGALTAARAAGLRVIADHPLNVYSTQTMACLQDLGADAAVISLECSSREVARLAARASVVEAGGEPLPKLALVAHGRLPAMLTRQEHGLAAGEVATIQAVERDGGLPYELQRRTGGNTVVWEGRRLCCPEQVVDTATLVDAWVLELADLGPDAVGEITVAYAALRAGTMSPEALETITARHAPHGLFQGHLQHGSRELDLVLERQL